MKKLNLNCLLVTLTSLLLHPLAAMAQNVDVNFVGNVSSVLSINVIQQPTISAGNLSGNTYEATTPAIVNVNATAPFLANVSPPVPVGFSDPSGTQYTGFLSYQGTEVTHGTAMQINNTGSLNLGVGMRVIRPTAYPSGTYTYKVTLTLSPQ